MAASIFSWLNRARKSIRSDKYTKLKGEIIDSRHKKIDFEIDFAKQKKLDPNTR